MTFVDLYCKGNLYIIVGRYFAVAKYLTVKMLLKCISFGRTLALTTDLLVEGIQVFFKIQSEDLCYKFSLIKSKNVYLNLQIKAPILICFTTFKK